MASSALRLFEVQAVACVGGGIVVAAHAVVGHEELAERLRELRHGRTARRRREGRAAAEVRQREGRLADERLRLERERAGAEEEDDDDDGRGAGVDVDDEEGGGAAHDVDERRHAARGDDGPAQLAAVSGEVAEAPRRALARVEQLLRLGGPTAPLRLYLRRRGRVGDGGGGGLLA